MTKLQNLLFDLNNQSNKIQQVKGEINGLNSQLRGFNESLFNLKEQSDSNRSLITQKNIDISNLDSQIRKL